MRWLRPGALRNRACGPPPFDLGPAIRVLPVFVLGFRLEGLDLDKKSLGFRV
jgi:hypothetical protein